MIHLIEEKNYNKVKELIGESGHSIFPACVCNGDNPGWIFADDPENPTSAFVHMKKLGGTLVGNSDNDEFNRSLKENLESQVIAKLIKDGEEFFSVSGSDSSWETVIESIMESKDYDIEEVRRYRFKEVKDSLSKLNGGYEIKEITTEILNDGSIKNIDLLTNDIKTWWDTLNKFFDIGCGFLVLKNNELCGWSYSVCIVDSRVEIYIETVEKHRNQGLGTALAGRFIQYCIENNLQPEWEALLAFEHSMKIAEKVGFDFDYDYKVYEVSIGNKNS